MQNNTSVLCQIDPSGRTAKPTTLQEYGKMRERMIQGGWVSLEDQLFIERVTRRGHPWYGCLFNGHDLMEVQQQKLCWRMQTMIALDFDKCPIDPMVMVQHFRDEGLDPWFAYGTFSDGTTEGRSYRLVWKVEANLNKTYEDVRQYIKNLAVFAGGHADKMSMDPSRLWQGSNSGMIYFGQSATTLDLNEDFF